MSAASSVSPARHHLLSEPGVGLKDVSEENYIMLRVDKASHTSLKYWSQTSFLPRITLRTSSVLVSTRN